MVDSVGKCIRTVPSDNIGVKLSSVTELEAMGVYMRLTHLNTIRNIIIRTSFAIACHLACTRR